MHYVHFFTFLMIQICNIKITLSIRSDSRSNVRDALIDINLNKFRKPADVTTAKAIIMHKDDCGYGITAWIKIYFPFSVCFLSGWQKGIKWCLSKYDSLDIYTPMLSPEELVLILPLMFESMHGFYMCYCESHAFSRRWYWLSLYRFDMSDCCAYLSVTFVFTIIIYFYVILLTLRWQVGKLKSFLLFL